ncbi:MAG: universal stress protein, partial [bacterium]|nr:universal stress protein [bacterium]
MIKSVLVPYDGSNCSKSALSIAGSIAGLVGARVHGLFVDDIKAYSEIGVGQLLAASIVGSPAVPSPRSAEVVLKLEEQYESRLKLLKEEFRLVCTPGMLEGMFYSRIGDPAREIVEMAKTVDFVVIGHDSGSEFHAGRTSVDLLRTTTR